MMASMLDNALTAPRLLASPRRTGPPRATCAAAAPLGLRLGAAKRSANSLAARGDGAASTLRTRHAASVAAKPTNRDTRTRASGGSDPAGLAGDALTAWVKEASATGGVVVFSKTWCPYCSQVKGLFKQLGVQPAVFELDRMEVGDAVQAELEDLTGQRTVPSVFVGGKHIGGCDSTRALHSRGKLVPLLQEAGALAS